MHPQAPDPTPPEADPVPDTAALVEMERALAALPLREPSTALDARVAAALAHDAATSGTAPAATAIAFPGTAPRRSLWLTCLAVAAVVTLLVAVGLTAYFQPGGWAAPDQPEVAGVDPVDPHDARPGPAIAPVPGPAQPEVVRAGYNFQAEPVQLHWTRDLDAGVLTAENAQPVRAVRRQDVEQRVWTDPERGVTVQITRPRERLMVVKQPTF